MDDWQFEQARARVIGACAGSGGIGTLGEKGVHAVLKHYLEPNVARHEQRLGRYVADIVGEYGITEIQTRDLYRLRAKLTAFLEVAPVTVVHPLIRNRWIVRCDAESGRPLSRRKSPLHAGYCSALYELYGIKSLLLHPALRLSLLLLDVEERRTPDGGKRRGRPTLRRDALPLALIGRVDIACPADYRQLIPGTLPDAFTSLDFAACGEVPLGTAQAGLNVLRHVGAVRPVAKCGRYQLYAVNP